MEKYMNVIVAVDKNWAIGLKNKLLVSLETFPGGMPLKNRTNIVLTSNRSYEAKGALIFHTVEEVLEELKKYPSEDVYIIGGGTVYEQFLPYCSVAHVTRIDYAYEADTFFPNLDELPEWSVEATSGEKTYYDLEFEFVKYVKKH